MESPFFENKSILIISPECWDHLFVSKHHYAIELAKKNNKVFFLNPPSDGYRCSRTLYSNIWKIDYSPFVKGLRFMPKFIQRHLISLKYKQLQAIAESEFDIVWSFDNSVFFNFAFLSKDVFTISHIVDYSQNFQFSAAAKSANICLGVSQNIVGKLKLFNKHSFLVRHGLSLPVNRREEVRLPGQNTIKAMYAGNLNSIYLDKKTMFSLIDRFNYVDFIFAGSGGNDWPRYANCFFLGVIEPFRLAHYLAEADVLLMLYDSEKFPNQLTNAHKILEYLYSGKVIVGSKISDYENSDLLEMTNQENIIVLFEKVTSNLVHYNSRENMTRRQLYAEQNTYQHRIVEIEQLIEKYYLVN